MLTGKETMAIWIVWRGLHLPSPHTGYRVLNPNHKALAVVREGAAKPHIIFPSYVNFDMLAYKLVPEKPNQEWRRFACRGRQP
jgi:hypothetical protein